MTVQELIDILKTRDPSDVVCIESRQICMPIDDDWSAGHCYLDGELHYQFCIHASEDVRHYERHPGDCPACAKARHAGA